MGKLEKIEQLQKLKENGSITEEEFNKEKEKLLNNGTNKIIIVVAILIVAVIIAGICFYKFGSLNKEEVNKN